MLEIIILALLAEAIWENLKMIFDKGKFDFNRLGALIIGIIVSVATQMDLFALLNFNIIIPFVGSILTGILISRGANVAHDLLTKIQSLKN